MLMWREAWRSRTPRTSPCSAVTCRRWWGPYLGLAPRDEPWRGVGARLRPRRRARGTRAPPRLTRWRHRGVGARVGRRSGGIGRPSTRRGSSGDRCVRGSGPARRLRAAGESNGRRLPRSAPARRPRAAGSRTARRRRRLGPGRRAPRATRHHRRQSGRECPAQAPAVGREMWHGRVGPKPRPHAARSARSRQFGPVRAARRAPHR